MGQKSNGGKRPGAGRPKEVKKERFPVTAEEKAMILELRYKNISKITVKKEKPTKSLKQLLSEIK